MLVPVLRQVRLHIDFLHVKDLPVHLGARTADKGAERDIEMRALQLTAINTVSIERILDK